MATATADSVKTGITEVEVIRRWRGSAVNPMERCGIPDDLADDLASIPQSQGGPAVKILRRNVPATEGIGRDGEIGSDRSVSQMDSLISLIGTLIQELKAERKR